MRLNGLKPVAKKIKTAFNTKDSEMESLRAQLQQAIQTVEEKDNLLKQQEKTIQSLNEELQEQKKKMNNLLMIMFKDVEV